MFGTPKNRAKSWDAKKGKDPKKDRRKSKKGLGEEPETRMGRWAKSIKDKPNGFFGHYAKYLATRKKNDD